MAYWLPARLFGGERSSRLGGIGGDVSPLRAPREQELRAVLSRNFRIGVRVGRWPLSLNANNQPAIEFHERGVGDGGEIVETALIVGARPGSEVDESWTRPIFGDQAAKCTCFAGPEAFVSSAIRAHSAKNSIEPIGDLLRFDRIRALAVIAPHPPMPVSKNLKSVCTENLIRIDCATNRLNVSGDDRLSGSSWPCPSQPFKSKNGLAQRTLRSDIN